MVFQQPEVSGNEQQTVLDQPGYSISGINLGRGDAGEKWVRSGGEMGDLPFLPVDNLLQGAAPAFSWGSGQDIDLQRVAER